MPSRSRKVQTSRRPLLIAGVVGGVAVALLITIVIALGQNPGGPKTGPVTVQPGQLVQGQAPPDFSASTFDGKSFTLSSLKGQVVLINFFASWCTSCRAELPAMEEAYRAHKGQGFTIVGVNTLENGDGVAFYRELGLTFPAVFDPGIPGKIGVAYHVTTGLPASVFLDRSGRVDLIQFGGVNRSFIERELQKLL